MCIIRSDYVFTFHQADQERQGTPLLQSGGDPEDRLLAYPWSSFGLYLAAREHRPVWLQVDRLLGEHGIQQDTPASRQEFERCMERRRLEEVDPGALETFRREWCLGSENFRKEQLERMEGGLGPHHAGELRVESAQAKADRLVAEELRRLGWTADDLVCRPKNDPGKLAIAVRLRQQTTLTIKAITARVHLGTYHTANANEPRSVKNRARTILILGLACLCLPLAESKAKASGSLYFAGTANSYMQFTAPFYGGGISSGDGGQRSNGGVDYGDYSIEFWFRPDSIASQTIFSSYGSKYEFSYAYVISTGSDGSINMSCSANGGDAGIQYSEYVNSGPNLINAGVWQHIAITCEAEGYFAYPMLWQPLNSIYLNGGLVSTNFGYADHGSGVNWIADSPPILGQGYAGAIGELRECSRALSQAEIQTNMSRVLNPTNESNLFGYWRFTEGTSNIVHDLAGTNSGIIYGAIWNADLPNTALQPPSIIQQPLNQTVFDGMTNVMSSAVTSGSLPFEYQWMYNSTNIQGATSSKYTIPNVSVTNLGVYSVTITNPAGSVTSSNATLTMYPFIASAFAGTTVLWGQIANLLVNPAGTGPFAYQWLENGTPINGATNQTYIMSSFQFTNAGFYSVVVTSPYGSVTNTPAQVVVNPAGVAIGMYPGVTITGTPGYNYTIQSTPSLSSTNGWLTLTNLTLQSTQQIWFDSSVNAYNPANPQRFYQVVPGQ